MEEQEQKNKECFRCGNFRCYYTKGQYRFNKTQQGYCIGKGEIVNKHGTCEKWCSNYKKILFQQENLYKGVSGITVGNCGDPTSFTSGAGTRRGI